MRGREKVGRKGRIIDKEIIGSWEAIKKKKKEIKVLKEYIKHMKERYE